MCWHKEFKNPLLVWLLALLEWGLKSSRTWFPSLHYLAMLSSALLPSSGKPSLLLARWLPEVLGLYFIFSAILSKQEFLALAGMAQLVAVSSRTQKDCGFYSWSGHIPSL